VAREDANVIQDGSVVSIEYKLTLDDGTEVDTNVGKEPLVYTQGEGQIIPGLEKEMVGLALGDTKTVKVSAKDGYGDVNPEALREVEAEQVPEDARKEGAMLMAEGHGAPIRVHEVREDKIVLDFNHPLAGQALNFDVKVILVE
jgi:FKBP-type peptidyl-prolyl cis-trans isomerase 2